MDYIVKGIVVKTVNYKEADKIASIFTLEEGVITARFSGVRRANAKLKAMSQPFSLCEFSINKTKNHRTITSAFVIDLFNNLTTDYSRMICGYVVLDMIKSILMEEKVEREIFLSTINAFKNIETFNPYIATIDYILKFLNFSGLEVQYIDAPYVYLSRATGEFSSTRDEFSYEIDKNVYSTLRLINFNKQVEENNSIFIKILKMLHNIIYAKCNVDIKSFDFL